MTDSLLTTDRLIADAERAARQVRSGMGPAYRTALLDARNKLRSRTLELEGRLATADRMYPHDGEIPARYEEAYLEIEREYRSAHNAAQEAAQALTGA